MSIEATYPLLDELPAEPAEVIEGQEGLIPKPLEHMTNHVEDGLSRLLYQFQGKPRIEAWLRALLNQCQDIEDASWTLKTKRTLTGAEGVQVDGFGEIVGQARNGLTDDVYKAFIRARIRVNLSSGTGEEIIEIVKLILGQTFPFHIDEYFPASFRVTLLEPTVLDPMVTWQIITLAKAVGVRMCVVHIVDEIGHTFTLGSSASPGSSDTIGLGSISDPEIGGSFAGVIY